MLPLPFTVSTVLLFVAVSISKLQYQSSCFAIALHALLGPLETGALAYSFIVYMQRDQSSFINFLLFLIALSLIGIFNFLGFAIQTPFIVQDRHFLKWMRRRQKKDDLKFNSCWFYLITLLSLFSNFKLKYIIFSGLFNFDCLKCKLQRVQKFRIFNVFSFLCLIPEIITLYSAIAIMVTMDTSDALFMVLLDTVIIFALNILFSVLAAKKDNEFFREQLHGLPIHKVWNVGEEEFQSSNQIATKHSFVGRELEDIIELDQVFYNSTLRQNARAPKETQAPEKISECTEEDNTVTESRKSESQKIEKVELNQNREDEQIRQTHNILVVDDVYDFDQYPPLQVQENIESEYAVRTVEVQKSEEIPTYYSRPEKIPEESSNQQMNSQPPRQAQIDKIERVNLTQYLLSLQQDKLLKGDKPNKKQKYDKVEIKDEDLPVINTFEDTLKSSLIEELKKVQKQKKHFFEENNKEIANSSEGIEDEGNSVRKASFRLNEDEIMPSLSKQEIKKIEKSQNIKQIIQRVVRENRSLRKSIDDSHGSKNIMGGDQKISILTLNEDHDERPIKNKSKEKLSLLKNHPIHTAESSHPLRNQRPTTEDFEVTDQSPKEVKYSIIRTRKMKTQNIQGKDLLDKITKSYTETEGLGKEECEPVIKDVQFYEDYLQKESMKNDLRTKQFIRSEQPQSQTLFLHQMEQKAHHSEQLATDRVPSHPTMIFRLGPKQSQSRSIENVRNASSSAQRRRRRKKLNLSNLNAEDRRRMRSLEKIYMEKQLK